MNQKKRILSAVLCLVFAFSLFAGAADTTAPEDDTTVCTCTSKCAEGAVNQECPVCKDNYGACTFVVTEEPKETETLKETEVPQETETPKETEVPQETETPKETEVPQETETPKETEAPKETETPKETEVPKETETPKGESAPVSISSWNWVGTDSLNEGVLPLTTIASIEDITEELFAEVVKLLPSGIQAEGVETVIPVTWKLENLVAAGEENMYTITAVLPEGYVLAEGAAALSLPVLLGGGIADTLENRDIVYVGGNTDSDDNSGAADAPVATISKALEILNEGGKIILAGDVKEIVNIPEGRKLTLDLNGKTLTGADDGSGNLTGNVLTNKGELTIIDSSSGGTILGGCDKGSNTNGRKGIALVNEGICYINGGIIKRADNNTFGNYTVKNSGTMTINDGEITNNSNVSSLIINLNVLNISGGHIQQDSMTAVKNDTGITTITGGEIVSKNNQAVQNWATVNISSGNLTGVVSTFTWTSNGENSSAVTNISGGTITGNINAINYEGTAVNAPVVNITGGTIIGNLHTYCGTSSNSGTAADEIKADINVSGGSFTEDIAKYLVPGYILESSDGSFTVAKEPIDDEQSLLNALSRASEGEVIVLDGNISLDKMLDISKDGVTIDLNGHSITASENFAASDDNSSHVVNVSGDNVTIKNGTIAATSANKHTLNVYQASGVKLEGLTLDHSKSTKDGAPLIVNASDVTVSGALDLKVGANSWYGINVDPKQGSAAISFADGSTVTMTGNDALKVLQIDGKSEKVTVTGAEDAGLTNNGDGSYSGGHVHTYTWNWDDSKHWKECSCSSKIDEGAHSFEKVIVAATDTTAGYSLDRCTVCGYETNKTIIPISVKITHGDKAKWLYGSNTGLTFRSNGELAYFKALYIDGTWVNPQYYSTESGSTILKLSSTYLKSLSVGKHTLRMEFDTATSGYANAYADTVFYVYTPTSSPFTGDNSNILLWSGLLLAALAGMGGTLVYVKKRKTEE